MPSMLSPVRSTLLPAAAPARCASADKAACCQVQRLEVSVPCWWSEPQEPPLRCNQVCKQPSKPHVQCRLNRSRAFPRAVQDYVQTSQSNFCLGRHRLQPNAGRDKSAPSLHMTLQKRAPSCRHCPSQPAAPLGSCTARAIALTHTLPSNRLAHHEPKAIESGAQLMKFAT